LNTGSLLPALVDAFTYTSPAEKSRQVAQKAASGFGEFADNTNTPGNAAPFELGESPGFCDSFDIAKTPNDGESGTRYTDPGSGQMRLW
jgi:hypothetical protein